MKITKEQFRSDYNYKYFYHSEYGICQIIDGFYKKKNILKDNGWFKKKDVIGTETYLAEIEILYMNTLGEVTKGYMSGDYWMKNTLPDMMKQVNRIIKSYKLLSGGE